MTRASQLVTMWKFHDFLSLRFYVKSILKNVEVLKLPFLAILESLDFGFLVNFSRQKFIKIQNSEPQNVLKWQILHF